jgi:Bacterial SH3 domain
MTKSIFLKRLSATVQFVLGFILGIALISGIAVGAGYLYFRKMSATPEKPVFSEETAKSTPTKTPEQSAAKLEPAEAETKAAVSQPEPKPELELPPNAYMARVTWPQGLSLRSEPDLNAAKVGGIEHNAEIVILEDSADGKWQKVRLPWSEEEGWVKANFILGLVKAVGSNVHPNGNDFSRRKLINSECCSDTLHGNRATAAS